MKRKNLLIVLALLALVPAAAFTLPHLAVLEAVLDAGIDPSAGPLVTSKIEEAFVNSGKFTVLDRANIDRVLQEKEFQLSSGIVRNEEVRQAGEYLGADVAVVATVSRIGQTYVVSAKMIDVVSGEIAAQTSAEKSGRVDVLLEVARMVGGRLAGTDIFIVSVDEQRAQEVVKDEQKAPPPREEPTAEEAPPPAEEKSDQAAAPRLKHPWEKPFIVGVRGGLNVSGVGYTYPYYYVMSDLLYSYYSDDEPYATIGGNFGLYIVMNAGRYLAWQVELDYSQKGYAVDVLEDSGFVTQTNYITFNYLEVPVLAKFKLPGRISPYGLLGVYLSLWLNGQLEVGYDNSLDQDTYDTLFYNPADLEENAGWEFNAFDFGWVAGLGVDVFLGSLVLNAEVKYSGGVLYADANEWLRNGALTATAAVGWAF
jgi:hypothetical protein